MNDSGLKVMRRSDWRRDKRSNEMNVMKLDDIHEEWKGKKEN